MRFKNIDFLRFFFAVSIVYFHIFSSMSGGTTLPVYKDLAAAAADGYLVVEMFFILSGFFLYHGYMRHPEISWTSFALGKICRLWPLMAFVYLFCVLVYKNLGCTLFLNLFFLQSTGLVLEYQRTVALWFVSALFWALLFYYFLFKNFSPAMRNLIIAVISFFSYIAVITYNHGAMRGAGGPVLAGFLNLGLLRSLAGVGWGCLLAQIYERLSARKRSASKPIFAIFSVLELCALLFILIYTTVRHHPYPDKFIFIIVFSFLLLSFCLHLGIISRVLENSLSSWLGKYSYAIYVMQIVAFYICSRFIWRSSVVAEPWLNISITLLLGTVLGMAAYHLIERPVGKFLAWKLR